MSNVLELSLLAYGTICMNPCNIQTNPGKFVLGG